MLRHKVAVTAVILALSVGLHAQAKQASPKAPAPAKNPPAVVNLNTATPAQLDALPGIGPKVAARIVEYRQKNGGFKKIEELMNIKGIGEKSFLKLKPYISVGQPKSDHAQQPPVG